MADNIASNTRVRVCRISERSVIVTTLDSSPRTFVLPRMRFRFTSSRNRRQFTLLRTQFPLRLAYAMTYNKSQGQTLNRLLLDVRDWCFAHGHLYVALSRIRCYMDIRFMMPSKDSADHFQTIDGKLVPTIYNVIHQSIIASIP
jgi:hypothetical protein